MTEFSPQLKKRLARIKAEVPIAEVLASYGYPVRGDLGDRQQQFPCDLHGDGKDGRFSARIYSESNTFFCFACGRPRDPIALVREKEGKGFLEALRLLEKRYDLPPIFEDDEPEEVEPFSEPVGTSEWVEERPRVYHLLTSISQEKLLPLKLSLQAWKVFDQVNAAVESKSLEPVKAAASLQRLRVGLLAKMGATDA